MTTAISMERWAEAQTAERKCHPSAQFTGDDRDPEFPKYRQGYTHVFNSLGINFDLGGRSVLEIGPARIAALCFCHNYAPSFINEPMPWEGTEEWHKARNVTLIKDPAETADLPMVDEVWLFNVLQHVIDPSVIISRCKEISKVIRFFEPIDVPTNDAHPHVLTRDLFVHHFGPECVKIYQGGSIPHFHSANCCYGSYVVA